MSGEKDRGPETPPSTPPTPHGESLADVFSDSPPTSPSHAPPSDTLSDVPRLYLTHTTAGYREGVAVAKQKSIQQGFDEGFPLGAEFGLRVGTLLGMLDGIYASAIQMKTIKAGESRRLQDTILASRQDLALEKLFGKEFWGEDGLWKYEVRTQSTGRSSADDGIVFDDIIESHPLIRKWKAASDAEAERWGIAKTGFNGEEWENGRLQDR